MKKGENFSLNGKIYEVLQDDLDFVETQKACIRPQGEKRCLLIERALKSKLIREVGQSKDATAEDAHPQLPLSYDDARKQKDELPHEKITEVHGEHEITANFRVGDGTLFFMPVDQLRAQVFLAHGLIYPAIWDKAVVSSDFDDIQKHDPAVLTLFAASQPINKNQLLLGVLLQAEEVKACNLSSSVLRFPIPLPISRLLSIGISPEQGDLNRYIAGWVKPDVPVPRHLFSVAPSAHKKADEDVLTRVPQDFGTHMPAIDDSIRKFDRYMGLIAFLRNTDRYFSSKTGYYADYTEEFFGLCSAITRDSSVYPHKQSNVDPLIMSLLDQEGQLSDMAQATLSLVTSVDAYIEKERARLLAMEIYKITGENEDLGQAFRSLFSGDYRASIQVLQQSRFPSEAGILAALFKFSSRQSNDHRSVKQRLHEDWHNPKQVVPILGVLGAYYGYTALDAKETSLYSVHSMLKKLVEQNPEIKFHLHTLFERQLVEALYQWAFYRRVPDKSIMSLYAKIQASTVTATSGPQGTLVRDRSYRVHDLFVRRYEVTIIGRIIQRIRDFRAESVDERSELGRCLLSQCFFLADEFELSRKRGQDILHFRISKERLADLIESGRVTVNTRIIETAIEEDAKKSGL